MRSLPIHLVTLIIMMCAAVSGAQTTPRVPTGELSGTVVNHATQQPVSGATVAIMGMKLGAVSRATGAFRIAAMPPGTYNVAITCIGYEPRTISDVSVRSGHTTSLTVELDEKDVKLDEATIVAPLFHKDADNITSTHTFNYEEVRRAPGAAEDVSRIAQSMPGVAFTNDGRNDLVVRGGSPTENLTVIDGIEIPNINHFGTQGAAGGPIGMLDVNLIDDVQFSSGGFRAEYGDKLSSVMAVRLREGNRDGFQGNANLTTAGVGAVLEGPLSSRGAYMFSVRRSYLNLIHNLIGLTAVPNYQDMALKLTYDLSQDHHLSLLFLGGLDAIRFDANAHDSTGLQFTNTSLDQWQGTAGLSWRWLWGAAGYSDVAAFTNLVNYDIHARDTLNAPTFNDNSQDREFGLRAKAVWQVSKTYTLTGGVTAKAVDFTNTIFWRKDSVQFRDPTGLHYRTFGGIDMNSGSTATKLGAFVDLAAQFAPLTVTGGVRVDHCDYLTGTNTVVAPRASTSYAFSEATSVNASYGLFYQAPELVWMTTVPENRGLSYMRSWHAIVGLEHQFDSDLKLTVEAYDKEYSDYPVSLANPYFVLANGGADYGVSIPGAAHSSGTGHVRGIDVFLQKKLMGNIYGLVSYSFSRAEFQGDAGGMRPGAFDYRHLFTIIAGYTIDNDWEFSAKWRFAGGRPYTPFDAMQSAAINQGVADDAQYNLSRLPDYSRLDVRVEKRSSFAWGNLVGYFELQNAYARNNVLQFYWNTTKNTQGEIYQWGFLPVGGFKLEF